eukprot:CAMPEP_0168597824 /NCGR_PEP_ID=MMETSP0420-20121227/10948_1 /TAXON_ID=498008 /ORGANISM="Pessonella sp." /LENGTH=350 /DNA_ID=CAMNT_0008634857 /DNA_START=446 /DNA_END=1494 /DNA_ORIENTATION=-
MSNSVIVNFHANTATFARASVTFRLGDAHGELFREYNATCAHVDSIDEEQRVVCWADATQLQPGQTYSIDVKLFANEQQTTPFARGPHLLPVDPSLLTYRVPDPSKPITFIAGGDYQVGPDARALTKFAMLHKPQPSFAMLGGDVTYSNAIKTCYRRYDRFFREWYEVASSVPLIVSPGNHDAGSYFIGGEIDSKKLNVVARRRDVPFYIRYFPQHTNLQSTPINDRLTYHSHKLGNLISVLSIDANVIEPMNSTRQIEFIEETLSSTNSTSFDNVSLWFISSKKFIFYLPLFDKVPVSYSFEHHYHVFKATKSLLANAVVGDSNSTKGVTYLGDGAWGIDHNGQGVEHW